MANTQRLIEKYCWGCEDFTGEASPASCGPYADPREDWCVVTAGELDIDELEEGYEDELEPGSEEHKEFLSTKVFDGLLSTGYFSEEEAIKIVNEKIKEATETRKAMQESLKHIKPIILPTYVEPLKRIVKEPEPRVHPVGKRRPIYSESEIREWLLKTHRLFGEIEFPKIMNEYKLFLGYKLTCEDKYDLTFTLQNLVKEGKLGFKDGKTYLIEKNQ